MSADQNAADWEAEAHIRANRILWLERELKKSRGRVAEDLRAFLGTYKAGFGAGVVPFDRAYFDAEREGDNWPVKTRKGCHALLDDFVAAYEKATGLDQEASHVA